MIAKTNDNFELIIDNELQEGDVLFEEFEGKKNLIYIKKWSEKGPLMFYVKYNFDSDDYSYLKYINEEVKNIDRLTKHNRSYSIVDKSNVNEDDFYFSYSPTFIGNIKDEDLMKKVDKYLHFSK